MFLKTESVLIRIDDEALDNFLELRCVDDRIVLTVMGRGDRVLLPSGGKKYYADWARQIETAVARRQERFRLRPPKYWDVALFVVVVILLVALMAAFRSGDRQADAQTVQPAAASAAAVDARGTKPAPMRPPSDDYPPIDYPQITDPDPVDGLPTGGADRSSDPLFGSADETCIFRPQNVRIPAHTPASSP